MSAPLGIALNAFGEALTTFQAQINALDAGALHLLPEQQEWLELLRYKLAPQFAGDGCLIIAVCGGTNTGKSTVFNMLLERDASPVRITAAATCSPVLALAPALYADGVAGKLIPEFDAQPLVNPEAAIDNATPAAQLFVVQAESLPERLAIMDTPDVDSIDLRNWNVANYLRAAGDVLVAVLTGEKYKDQRVIDFFRHARSAGRKILPLMNKANPENNYEVARVQLQEFVKDVGLPQDTPCFVAPHDFTLNNSFAGTRDKIIQLETGMPLMAYLESLDVVAIKKEVYRESILRFAEGARKYLDYIEQNNAELKQVAQEFEHRTEQYVNHYDPAPGAAVGGLFHEFVQSKRGGVGRAIGNVSQQTTRAIGAVGRTVSRTLFPFRGASISQDQEEKSINTAHREMLTRITDDLARSYVESAQNLPGAVGVLVKSSLDSMNLESIATETAKATLKHDDVSEAFREHAFQQMEDWWENHKLRRNALISLDYVLMISPAAIAGVMSVQTAGAGVYETMIFAGPLMEQFAARVIEYQFGDALFGLLKPWREEQRAQYLVALMEKLTEPVLENINNVTATLEGDAVQEMGQQLEACLQAL